jgi:hypothetical protein
MTKTLLSIGGGVLVLIGLYMALVLPSPDTEVPQVSSNPAVEVKGELAKTPNMVTLTGTYVCLPAKAGVTTADCAFGIKTDEGVYYAVNFGAGAGSMADFKDGATITAQGTLIHRADLNPDSWTKFEMQGLFTVLEKK